MAGRRSRRSPSMQIKDISTHVLDKYYQSLLRVRSKATNHRKPQNEYLTAHTVREIHKLLRSCFNQAVKWDLLQRNPCDRATLPKEEHAKREIWDMKTLQKALSLCDDTVTLSFRNSVAVFIQAPFVYKLMITFHRRRNPAPGQSFYSGGGRVCRNQGRSKLPPISDQRKCQCHSGMVSCEYGV